MSNTSLRFPILESDNNKTPRAISKKLVKEVFSEQVPISNPDFTNILSQVALWLIEFEDDSYYPNREIGVDANETPIVIMPWKRDYGYWTDSNVIIKNIMSNFAAQEIPKEQFIKNWKLFEDVHK
jgi:hypothetical protein